LHTAFAVSVLQEEHLVGPGEAVEVGLAPVFGPMVCLGFAGQIAVQADFRKKTVPELYDPLSRPDVGPHVHPYAKFVHPVVYGLSYLSFDKLSHPFSVEL